MMRVWRDVADRHDERWLLGLRRPKSQPNGAIGLVCLPVADGESTANRTPSPALPSDVAGMVNTV